MSLRLSLLFLFLLACGAPSGREFYSLSYPPTNTRFAQTHPVTVRVKDLSVRGSYRGSSFVFRRDVHELRYYRSRRWSEKPGKMISQLLRDHLRTSGLVREVVKEIGLKGPEYSLSGELIALEELQLGEDRYAHLALNLNLKRFEDEQIVWRWQIDERRAVGNGALRSTVRALSEILAQGIERALKDLDRQLSGRPKKAPSKPEALIEIPNLIKPGERHQQMDQDDTPMPVGFGALFLPSLAERDEEPLVTVYSEGGEMKVEGQMGQRLVLPPGIYKIHFGSGTLEQQLSEHAQVEAGRVTLIPAKWAALTVAVLDAQFVPHRGSYELVRMDRREQYGLGFGADEQQGERLKSWVLAPGLYKIIQAGGNYRDRRNFATVRLLSGRLSRFTLVLDPETGDFEGAGEADPHEDQGQRGPWSLKGILGGDIAFNRNQQLGEQEGFTLGLSLFFDGSLSFKKGQHLWYSRLELEEQQSRPPEMEHFRNLNDRFYLHTIYTYQLLSWFGPYIRTGLESKLLPRYEEFDEPQPRVGELDVEGEVVRIHEEVTRLKLGGFFSPLYLQEGVGGNFRLLRSARLEIDLRSGLGARQSYARGLLIYEGRQLSPVQDARIEGLELTLLGRAQFSRWITGSSEFEGLFPFDEEDEVYLSWRNQISLRLMRFISLAYRFNALRAPNLGISDEIETEHDIQLRFSYTLF